MESFLSDWLRPPPRVARGWLRLGLGLAATVAVRPCQSQAIKTTSPSARQLADQYMAARDKGDYVTMAEILKQDTRQPGWAPEKVKKIDEVRLRMSGDVISRRFIKQNLNGFGAGAVLYDVKFSKEGHRVESVLIAPLNGRLVVGGHIHRTCAAGECFTD